MADRTLKIDLKEVIKKPDIKYLSGKDKGEAAREIFHINTEYDNDTPILIVIPSHLVGVSSSFTNGLLGNVYRSLGESKFVNLVKFDGDSGIIGQMLEALERGVLRPKIQ